MLAVKTCRHAGILIVRRYAGTTERGKIMGRKAYMCELESIRQKTIAMGNLTVEAVRLAADALVTNNTETAAKVRLLEKQVDELYLQIDDHCIVSIAKQQPMAGDLRFLISTIKIATEIERIADYANNIAKKVIKKFSLQDMSHIASLKSNVELMAQEASGMLSDAMRSYEVNNADLAAMVHKRDAIVNRLNKDMFRGLMAMVMVSPYSGELALDFHVAVRYLERVADRSTNVAEWVYYSATGYRFPDTKK